MIATLCSVRTIPLKWPEELIESIKYSYQLFFLPNRWSLLLQKKKKEKNQLIQIIFKELQTDPDFIDKHIQRHNHFITRHDSIAETIQASIIQRPDIATSLDDAHNVFE